MARFDESERKKLAELIGRAKELRGEIAKLLDESQAIREKMAELGLIPRPLRASTLDVACPECRAEPGQDCATVGSSVHVARIKAAAQAKARKAP